MRDRRRPVASLVTGCTAAFLLIARVASAQPPESFTPADSSLSSLANLVPIGATVVITDATAGVLKGKLSAISSSAIELAMKSGPRTIAANDVRRIQWQQPDSLLNGTLIGAGIGAIPGIYWLIADPNECAGLCAEDYVAIGVGAVVGALVDRAIKRRVTVYVSPGARTALQVAVRF